MYTSVIVGRKTNLYLKKKKKANWYYLIKSQDLSLPTKSLWKQISPFLLRNTPGLNNIIFLTHKLL